MVALLFTAVFIVGLLALVLYFWAPRAHRSEQNLFPPLQSLRGLFSDEHGTEPAALPAAESELEANRESAHISLRERAKSGDKSALNEAYALRDPRFYNEILDGFTAAIDDKATLLSLVSHITRNELPLNRKLAQAIITAWRNSPDRSSTATTLHLTALADDAGLYRDTVETALQLWQQGLLPNVSAAELKALFDGEFWVLSAQTRNSGEGFLLKRTLANARRELESAIRVN